MAAFAATFFPRWVQIVLFALGALSVLWSVAVVALHFGLHRRRLRQLPPTLYLRNAAGNRGHDGRKALAIIWKAETLDLTFAGALSRHPISEKTLTFELFNAGEEAVRHVELCWELPGVDIAQIVNDSGILGDSIRSHDDGIFRLARGEDHGAVVPYATRADALPIPVISGGRVEKVAAPAQFTTAYSLCALARAKIHHETIMPQMMNNLLEHLDKISGKMDDVLVHVSYVKADRKCRHSFRIVGFVSGGTQPLVHRPTDEAPEKYELTEGVVASIDDVEVIPA